MTGTRVLLVDDHSILRAGVKLMLQQHADIEVVGEAATVDEAVRLARMLEPQLVVLDLVIPGGGTAGIDAIRLACPGARIVVLSMHDEPAVIDESIAHGAHGYVTKASAAAELVLAIRTVSAGATFHCTAARAAAGHGVPSTAIPLSPREVEVLSRVAAGYTNKEVAAQLDISVKTVETYRARIGEKTGFKSRVEILQYALHHGLVGRPKV